MDGIDDLTYEQNVLKANKARKAAYELQQAKLRALQDALSNYGNFRYVDLEDFIDPNNQHWKEYKYYAPDSSTYLMGPPTQGYVNGGTPVGMFIQQVRDAKNINDVNEQFKLWNLYKPLDSSDNGTSYIRHFIPRFGMHSTTPSVGSRPVQTTAGGTGGAQGVVTVGGAQGAQAGVQAGAGVARGGVQSSNNGSSSAQGTQGVQVGGTGGTLASPGVPRGGTKTIGYEYDPNPNNVSLAYVMRNAPEQERRNALINKWNRENGRESVPYVPGTEIPAGSLNRSGSTGYATGEGMLTSGSNGTYATGEGIKDANGNVLTNPGGDWEYQYALKNPQYGLGMMGKMSDAQRNYLQAVSDDMGYNYNFRGATRFV